MNKHIIDLAQTCLGCKKPKCQVGCPINTPIPEMVHLFLHGDIVKAGQMLFKNNPLSIICSVICPHEKHCEGHCVLNKKSSPVSIGSIEHYISSRFMDTVHFEKPLYNGHDIAIVGGGPAGIALAFILAIKGYGVTIFDAQDKIGGVLQYGIPDFRLDKRLLDKLVEKLNELGVSIRSNTYIGTNITICDLFRDDYKAVFLSTGAWAPKKLNIKGESFGHVHFATNYLKNPSAYLVGKKIIVIGAGNVAIDVARTALRNGAQEACIMYHRGESDMSAEKHEIQCAKIDGVKFDFFRTPQEITKEGVKFVTNNEERLVGFESADNIFVSIGQSPTDTIIKNNTKIDADYKGFYITDEYGRTTREGVFAAGDAVTGARTVVEAVAFSKRTAEAIEEYINSLDVEIL